MVYFLPFLEKAFLELNQLLSRNHQNENYSGNAVDIFAAGIILFIMYTGHPPFSKANPKTDPYYNCFFTNKQPAFWNAHRRNKPP